MPSGERIKRAREKAGMTQQQLADAMHVNFTVISQYEHDRRNPKIETLKRIADAIGCSVYELMDPDTRSAENFEQIHMFNLRVEELKVQINFYRANGMEQEAESAERELKTLIGDREWSAGPVPDNKKTPATGSDGSVDADEAELVDNYKALNREGQEILLNTSRGLIANAQYKKIQSVSAG